MKERGKNHFHEHAIVGTCVRPRDRRSCTRPTTSYTMAERRAHNPRIEGSSYFLSINPIRTPIHTLVSMRRSLCALALVLILTGALSGCAVYNTYEKCGFYGCPGDAKITADILAQFSRRLDLEPNAITVQTLDHVVYLYGLVSSSLEIDTAESIARKVSGVTEVVNSMVAQTR